MLPSALDHQDNEAVKSLLGTSDGFVELGPNDFCYIDPETAKNLELVKNNIDQSNKRHTLFGYLNAYTSTTTGARMLHEILLRPLCHLRTLEHRLDCVEFLSQRVDNLGSITNSIKRFGCGIDLDNVVPSLVSLFKNQGSSLHMVERRLDALTTVEALVSQVHGLIYTLVSIESSLFDPYRIALEDPAFDEIIQEITNIIEPDSSRSKNKRSRMFRIKEGVESLFDIARNTFTAAINDLEQYVKQLHQEDGISWKLTFSETRGYYLSLKTDLLPKNFRLPPKYIQVSKSRNLTTCVTRDLMQSNVRASISYENSMKLANEILVGGLSVVMSNLTAIYKLVDIVGMLDLTTSFAKLASFSAGRLVRPVYSSTETILIKSRHPVLESILSVNQIEIVPNNLVFSTRHKNFMLITGPNMGGKSVLLRQAGLIQVMAQCGCFVPAESAHIKIMNRIVARSGANSDCKANCSSFMWDMKNIAAGLQENKSQPQESTLYIIDEVGRGTSIDDGSSFSFAIAEELAIRRYSFTIFATHFDRLFHLSSLYDNISTYRFDYDKQTRQDGVKTEPKINHLLAPGIAERDHYGIRLAEACELPDEILDVARRDLLMTKDDATFSTKASHPLFSQLSELL